MLEKNSWKDWNFLVKKNRNIASLPHIFYMNFSSPNPAFPHAQSPWSQVASNSPQDHSRVVVGFFCRGHFYSISKYWTNLPTPTSSIHLLSILLSICETHSLCLIGSCKGTAMQNTGNKHFSAASTLDTKYLVCSSAFCNLLLLWLFGSSGESQALNVISPKAVLAKCRHFHYSLSPHSLVVDAHQVHRVNIQGMIHFLLEQTCCNSNVL